MKSSDLYMKMPLSGRDYRWQRNSICDGYTNQQQHGGVVHDAASILQYGTLKEKNLLHFDAWASTFGETITAVELTPEGYTLIGR